MLGFRVPTTSVGQRVRGQRGSEGGKAYCILGFRVPTTSVGARSVGQRGAKGVKGTKGSKGVQGIFCTRFYGPHHLCGSKR